MKGSHNIRGFDEWWKFFCHHFSDLHSLNSGYLAMTRYLSAILDKVSVACSEENLANRYCEISPSSDRNDTRGENILFIPIIATSYCLGSCLKVANEVAKIEPEARIFFLKSFGDNPRELDSFCILDWRRHLKCSFYGLKHFKAGISFFRAYEDRVLSIPECRTGLKVLWGRSWKWKLRLRSLSLGMEIALAAKWLVEHRIGVVLTINDVVKPSAPFIAAARMHGVHTVLMQHGTPGPHNAPFAAAEFWSWGQSSTRMLKKFGADSSRIVNLGNLETEMAGKRFSGMTSSGAPRILVLLQWTGAAVWEDLVYKEIVLHVGTSIREVAPDWILHIRSHPRDHPDIVRECRETVSGYLQDLNVVYEYSAEGATIEDDVSLATAVITVNSSALAHAISQGIPHLQYLPTRLEQRIGTAFVSPEFIARDEDDLRRWLASTVKGEVPTQDSVEKAIANHGSAITLAAERLRKYLGNARGEG